MSIGESPVLFESRKLDHLRLALEGSFQAVGLSGFDKVQLVHEALPELNWEDLRLASVCLGFEKATPFYVSGMTAGHSEARKINESIAQACMERGWGFGVGSQRRELFDSSAVSDWEGFRRKFPTLQIFSNIGVSQLVELIQHRKDPLDSVRRIVDSVGANGLVIHLNALQECIQPEGTPFFKGALESLRRLTQALAVPVIVKETGCGISGPSAEKLITTGIAAIDVSGLGGTHWGRLEGARSLSGSKYSIASEVFKNWGISTADALEQIRSITLSRPVEIWASGGLRTGLDAAKAFALGAHQVGFAQPALVAVQKGKEALLQWMDQIEFELKVAMFCTGSKDLAALKNKLASNLRKE